MQQALQLVTDGQLQFDKDIIITLAALALQACHIHPIPSHPIPCHTILRVFMLQAKEGDYLSDSATRHHVDSLALIPDHIIIEMTAQLDKIALLVAVQYHTLAGT